MQEENAVKKFEEKTGKKVKKCGLFVSVENPHLAATPDGIVETEDAIIEVKLFFSVVHKLMTNM